MIALKPTMSKEILIETLFNIHFKTQKEAGEFIEALFEGLKDCKIISLKIEPDTVHLKHLEDIGWGD